MSDNKPYRTIKFRGKRIGHDEWIYGDLVHDAFTSSNEVVAYAIQPHGCQPTEVDPETIGQYVGLSDTQCRDMFERDIISFTYWWFDGSVAETQLIGEIVYSGENLSFQLKGVKNKDWERHTGYENNTDYLTPFSELTFAEDDFQIIGNAIDNPKLLELKK